MFTRLMKPPNANTAMRRDDQNCVCAYLQIEHHAMWSARKKNFGWIFPSTRCGVANMLYTHRCTHTAWYERTYTLTVYNIHIHIHPCETAGNLSIPILSTFSVLSKYATITMLWLTMPPSVFKEKRDFQCTKRFVFISFHVVVRL